MDDGQQMHCRRALRLCWVGADLLLPAVTMGMLQPGDALLARSSRLMACLPARLVLMANRAALSGCAWSCSSLITRGWQVRDFQSVIGKETRQQCQEKFGGLPDVLMACVGGGSNAMGAPHERSHAWAWYGALGCRDVVCRCCGRVCIRSAQQLHLAACLS